MRVSLATQWTDGTFIPPEEPAEPIFATSILNEAEFDNLEIAERPALLGDWFKVADTGYISGKRGLGKSWLALALARTLADGGKCGPYIASRRCRVLYVDGEMSAHDLRSRSRALRKKQRTSRSTATGKTSAN